MRAESPFTPSRCRLLPLVAVFLVSLPCGAPLVSASPATPEAAARPEDATIPEDPFDVLELAPGMMRERVLRRLEDGGVPAHWLSDTELAADTLVLPTVFEQQRVLLEFDRHGALRAVRVQFVPEPGSRGADVLRLYGDVRTALLRKLGRASWERSEGYATPAEVLYALSDGGLLRYLQWDGPPAVRAGIPRRVDGEVYVEILVASERPPRHEEFWGSRIH